MSKVRLADYADTAIWIDQQYGVFTAEVDGVFLQGETLEDLKTKIQGEKKAAAKSAGCDLECHCLIAIEGSYRMETHKLIGVNRSNSTRRFAAGELKGVTLVLPATEANARILEEMIQAREILERVNKIAKKRDIANPRWGGRISPSDYPARIARIKEEYAQALQDEREPEPAIAS